LGRAVLGKEGPFTNQFGSINSIAAVVVVAQRDKIDSGSDGLRQPPYLMNGWGSAVERDLTVVVVLVIWGGQFQR